jgi:hypothetical protein
MEHKTGYNKDTGTPVCIAGLFIIVKLRQQPRFPTTDGWIKKMWYIYTMEYYSVIRNDDMWFEGKWKQLEDIKFSEVSQSQKYKPTCFLSYVEDRYKR